MFPLLQIAKKWYITPHYTCILIPSLFKRKVHPPPPLPPPYRLPSVSVSFRQKSTWAASRGSSSSRHAFGSGVGGGGKEDGTNLFGIVKIKKENSAFIKWAEYTHPHPYKYLASFRLQKLAIGMNPMKEITFLFNCQCKKNQNELSLNYYKYKPQAKSFSTLFSNFVGL